MRPLPSANRRMSEMFPLTKSDTVSLLIPETAIEAR
jgi:hypothetical protein